MIAILHLQYGVFGSVLQMRSKRVISCGTTENSPSHQAIPIGGRASLTTWGMRIAPSMDLTALYGMTFVVPTC